MNIEKNRSPWLYHLGKFGWVFMPMIYGIGVLNLSDQPDCGRACQDSLEGLFVGFLFIWAFFTPFFWTHQNNMIWLMERENNRTPNQSSSNFVDLN